MAYGVTPTGFVAKPLQVIRSELESGWQGNIRANLNVTPQSRNGQIIGILAERLAELWELAEAVYAAFTPDGASGAALVQLAGLTGTVPDDATPSEVDLVVTGTAGTNLLAGRVVSVLGTGTRFATVDAVVLAAAPLYSALGAGAAVVEGEFRSVTDGSGSRVYRCSVGGNVTPTAPTGTGAGIVDGTAEWDYMGPGLAYGVVAAESEETGQQVANARTLTVIETPVAGWSGVMNVLDATLGSEVEKDAALRARRELELRASGDSTAESIRGDMLKVEGVITATVFVNDDDEVDGDGLPPHSIEVLVEGGTDAAVAQQIWESKGAGIETYGSTTVVVVDSDGVNRDVKFTRPAEIPIYVAITVKYDAEKWPVNGDDLVKDAIVEWGDALGAGRDVTSRAVGAQPFVAGIPGVLDTDPTYIGVAPAPVSQATIAINLRQKATFDHSRITVTATPVTP